VVLCVVFSTCSNVWGPLNNIYDSKVAVPAPVMGIAGGTYNQDQTVSLACTFPGAAIYYTLDGSTPTSASTLYSSPITISGVGARVTLKALASYSRKIDSAVGSATYVLDTLVSTIVGDGIPGLTGDNGPASSARVNGPMGVACDSAGNIYIADSSNDCIRKIDQSTGNISTFLAAGTSGLGHPMAISVSGGFLYADGFASGVAKVDLTTKSVTIIAGGGGSSGYGGDGGPGTLATLNAPDGAVVDSAGNVYIADGGNNRIRVVDHTTLKISTIAGTAASGYLGDGGPASAATLSNPSGGAFDASGDYYFADSGNFCVRKIDTLNGIITTVAGGTQTGPQSAVPAISAGLNLPYAVAFNSKGDLFIVTEASAATVWKVDHLSGLIYIVAGGIGAAGGFAGDGGPASSAQLSHSRGICFDAAGNLYIADTQNNRIRKVAN
jgi:hypothetical protein